MKRLKMVALVLGLSPLLMGAGGGGAPPGPGEQIAHGPRFNAVITVDAHNFGVTSTAGQGSITIFGRGISTTGPISLPFVLLSGFSTGCITDPAATQSRFANLRLEQIMPSRRSVIELLAPLDVEVSFDTLATVSLASPIITTTRHPRCAGPFDSADNGAVNPGVQIFDAQIKLVIPAP
jgi:hypothetical protein